MDRGKTSRRNAAGDCATWKVSRAQRHRRTTAENAVALSIYGDEGTTELALQAASDALNQNCFGIPERFKAMRAQFAAIIKANPKTEEELKAVVAENPIPLAVRIRFLRIYEILTLRGSRTRKTMPTRERGRQETAPTPAVDIEFNGACKLLKMVSAKPSATFLTSELSADELDMLGNFLKQIAASKRKADPIVTPALSQPAATPTPSATESA